MRRGRSVLLCSRRAGAGALELTAALWDAIHHRRTLYGRVCSDVRAFFDAIDQGNTGQITREELREGSTPRSDMVPVCAVFLTRRWVPAGFERLDVALTPTQLGRLMQVGGARAQRMGDCQRLTRGGAVECRC